MIWSRKLAKESRSRRVGVGSRSRRLEYESSWANAWPAKSTPITTASARAKLTVKVNEQAVQP